MTDGPRILFIDIETKPATAYVWRAYDENVSPDQIVDPGGTICFAARFSGEKKMRFHADWIDGHQGMIEAAHSLLSEADAIVTYNGDRFDIPKLQGEFLLANLPPPPPPTSIDVYKTVRKLGLFMNKLAFIGPQLCADSKVPHEGFKLWRDVMAGCPKAEKKMERYCRQDVKLLEDVYERVKGYIPNHPHLASLGSESCGACGSRNVQHRGVRRTKSFHIARLQCQDCGSWQSGRKIKAAA